MDRYDFEAWKFSLYFFQSLPVGTTYPHEPGSDAAHRYLWSTNGVTLELTHNWGTEDDPAQKYHPGNEPGDGFGHIAFAVPDVYAATERLEAAGVTFKKKPDEGRMKGIAFFYDSDGYWVELVERAEGTANAPYFTLAQTMLRVKDPKKSLEFYTKHFGLTLVRESHYPSGNFSNYFLATLPLGTVVPDPASEAAKPFMRDVVYPAAIPVLELTHNHGTEADPAFSHRSGNVEPHRGFGHVGFLTDDVYSTSAALEAAGVAFQKKPDAGSMKGLAFALDPDGYWVEIIKRGQEGKF